MSPPQARFVCALALIALPALGAPEKVAPTLAWEVVSHQTPRFVWANMKENIVLRLRNVGDVTWTTETSDFLAYHWLAPDGQVRVRDGLRSRFPHEVSPGETVEIVARVQAPAEAGRYLLEWEPVREQVRWYGPPRGGDRLRVPVRVTWRCAWLQGAFVLASLAAVLAGRILARRRPVAGWWWRAVVPPVWAWAAVELVTLSFSELVGRQLWTGAGWLAASGAAVLATPAALVPVRARTWVAAAVAALASLVAVGDLVYLRWFGNLVPIEALLAAQQLGQVEGSIRRLLAGNDVWLAPAVLAAVLVVVLAPRARREARPALRERRLAYLLVAVCFVLASWHAGRSLRRALADRATASQVFSEQMLVGQWGVVNVHLMDVARALGGTLSGEDLSPERLAEIRGFFAKRAADASPGGPGFGAARGCSLILIQVESLQQWLIGTRVGGEEITPFLNSLPGRGLYFSAVFDQSAEGRSSDGEFVTLNSQLPMPRGAVAFMRAGNRFRALPAVLAEHGYATLSAHAFERGFWNRAALHPRYGFERSLFQRELGTGEVIGWGLADGTFLQRMVPQINRLDEPFFAFLITLGLHHPFDQFPARHKVLDVGALTGTPLGNYIHAMHYLDGHLERFVAGLDGAGLLDRTVVALYGDHESGLDIDSDLRRLLGAGEWDPSLPLRLRRVPFFALLPGAAAAGEVATVGGHVDIAPTLLHLLGLPRPESFFGTALLPGRPIIATIPGGSAVGGGLLFASRGARIPDEGACFTFPGGRPRPLADCRALRETASKEIQAAAEVLDFDLIPALTDASR